MSLSDSLVTQLQTTRKYFEKTLSVFESADETFAPNPVMLTVSGHVAHAADTVDWFLAGAFGDGWDLDFEASMQRARDVTSLEDAKAWLARAFDTAVATIAEASDEQLAEPIPDKRMMGGAPRSSIVGGITDHTAHHRGALAVYARLLGKEPPVPYL